jgi:acetyl esterase/lipase
MTQAVEAQTIQVWPGQMPDGDWWLDIGPELERPRRENSRLVRNVGRPTLTVYLPEPSVAVGTGVVICPGGGFHFLMVDKEGADVARYLTERGVAAFVLKYRLVPTPDDDDAFTEHVSNLSLRRPDMERVRPMCVADGLQALRMVREQAATWNIAPDRLGIVGFSAGGAVTAGVATEYDAQSRPDFAAPIYAVWNARAVPADVPPLFLAAATDDPMVDVQHTLALYAAWRAVGRPAELHLYGQGGHGFGMNRQGLPSDGWIDRFWEWLQAQGFVPNRG